jgi:hypothetical protein
MIWSSEKCVCGDDTCEIMECDGELLIICKNCKLRRVTLKKDANKVFNDKYEGVINDG